ncbi:unnamed protein product [Camellia sinensis]
MSCHPYKKYNPVKEEEERKNPLVVRDGYGGICSSIFCNLCGEKSGWVAHPGGDKLAWGKLSNCKPRSNCKPN